LDHDGPIPIAHRGGAAEGPEILDSPAEVIRMASEFANTGFPELLDRLVGQVEPTLNLMVRLEELRQ